MPRMTEQQLRDYCARMQGTTQHVSEGMRAVDYKPGFDQIGNCAPIEVESYLHYAIIDYCDSKAWVYLHGSMSKRTHRTEGEPDFVILAADGKVFFVECKSKTGKLSQVQKEFAVMAKWLGHTIHVVRSLEEFINLVTYGPSET